MRTHLAVCSLLPLLSIALSLPAAILPILPILPILLPPSFFFLGEFGDAPLNESSASVRYRMRGIWKWSQL